MFNVGDRVKYNSKLPYSNPDRAGLSGTVCSVDDNGVQVIWELPNRKEIGYNSPQYLIKKEV